jgi:mannosyltransferase
LEAAGGGALKGGPDWSAIALLLLAALLRFPGLGARSLWFDEALSASIARLDTLDILVNVPGSFHPPGYYFLLHLWRPVGHSAFALRFPSALCSLLAVALAQRLAGEFFGQRTARLATLGMALSPFQVYYAQEARMYGPAIALGAGVVWAFLRAVRVNRRSAWLIYGVFATLGLYVYYYTGLVVLALHLWLLWDRRLRQVLLPLAVTDGLVALTFSPQLLGAFHKSGEFVSTGRTTSIPNPLELFRTLYYLLFGHVMPLWLVPVGLFLILGLLALGLLPSAKRRDRMAFALLSVILIPIALVMVLSALLTPLYIERSFALIAPALVVLLARCVAVAPRRSPTIYLGAALGLLLALGTVLYHILPDPAKPPLREAMATVERQALAGDTVLHLQDASYLPALYESPGSGGALADVGQRLWLPPKRYVLFGGRVVEPGDLVSAGRLWLVVMPGYVESAQVEWLKQWDAEHGYLQLWDWGSVQVRLYALGSEESTTPPQAAGLVPDL